jgi:hypothetical protein
MFRPYLAIFRQHTIKNEIYCTVRLSVVLLQIGCFYYRILCFILSFVTLFDPHYSPVATQSVLTFGQVFS